MDILRSSPVPTFTPFARSSNGVGSELDFDRLSGYGDDPRDSTSYVASMDLSPDPIAGWVMNSISSGESGFPFEWTPVSYDPIATSPMSTNLSEPGLFGSVEGIGDQFQHMADTDRSRTGSVTDPLEGLQQQQQAFDTRPIYQAQPTAPSVSGASQNVGWSYSGVPPLNFQTESVIWEEPVSASSYTTQSSYEPWSIEGQPRYRGIAGTDAPLFGPHTELINTLNQDVASWTSSPGLNPVATPSSSHSPNFSHPTLQQISHSPTTHATRPSLHLQVERTSRGRHTSSFARRPSSVVISQAQSSTQTSISSDRISEASRSPARDFVFVQSPTKATSSRTIIDQKLIPSQLSDHHEIASPRSPSSHSHQQQTTVFVQQHFPAKDSSNTRITTERELVRRTSGVTKRGGRAVGSHLSTEGAARAKQLREEGSCWLCCLQRDSCSPGEVCDRCIKRNQRATLEHNLGCDRTKLTELKVYFVPDVITRLHEPQALKQFCAQHIKRWSGERINIKFNVIWTLPPIECEVYEFEPKTRELLRQFQYITDPETRRRTRVEKASPPLAMVQIEHADRQKYDKYLSLVVDRHLEQFAERVYDIESEDFPTRLYRLMVRFKPDNKEEASLLRDIHRLLVCTYIMCRTATIPNSQKPLLYKLHSYPSSPDAYAHAPSPRMANRQLKYLFCQLQQQILDAILKKLQQVLRSSKGPQKWTSAFIAILGLAMSFELTQRLVHVVADADAAMAKYSLRDAEYVAETACRAIDEKFAFISNLFRWKYHRGFNPLREMERDSVNQVLGDKGVEFLRGVTALINEKHENFLFERQYVGISTENQDKYTSRLVARFFSSFLSPQ